jgi:hypothetical protein
MPSLQFQCCFCENENFNYVVFSKLMRKIVLYAGHDIFDVLYLSVSILWPIALNLYSSSDIMKDVQ